MFYQHVQAKSLSLCTLLADVQTKHRVVALKAVSANLNAIKSNPRKQEWFRRPLQ